MPSDETLVFVAGALKFSAVPAAAFELLSAQRRKAIEEWLVEKLPGTLQTFLVVLAILCVCVFVLIWAGPFVLLIAVVLNYIYLWWTSWDWDPKQTFEYRAFLSVLMIAVAVISGLEKWIGNDDWIVTIAHPLEAVLGWAKSNPHLDWWLPDFSGREFLQDFRNVIRCIEEWMWDWLAFIYSFYFFLSRGAIILMIALSQLLLFGALVIVVVVGLSVPLYLFMVFSDRVRLKLQVDKDRIPVGAFFFWATGETLDFGMKAHSWFWN